MWVGVLTPTYRGLNIAMRYLIRISPNALAFGDRGLIED